MQKTICRGLKAVLAALFVDGGLKIIVVIQWFIMLVIGFSEIGIPFANTSRSSSISTTDCLNIGSVAFF
ncbi:hypothetical protein [Methylomonas sp. DH-1]|uniref:hypothetical protein n=1 Tax=Methylomonas sp. (strain DH-1) TaxID=1727196 RepID=UPI0012F63CF1|nr:hypothetical protein [Methylomonas sp. DH-1]